MTPGRLNDNRKTGIVLHLSRTMPVIVLYSLSLYSRVI